MLPLSKLKVNHPEIVGRYINAYRMQLAKNPIVWRRLSMLTMLKIDDVKVPYFISTIVGNPIGPHIYPYDPDQWIVHRDLQSFSK